MFQLHSGRVNVAVMFISYRLEVLYPPPSLRDASAGGGYGMTFFAIATQSHAPDFAPAEDIKSYLFCYPCYSRHLHIGINLCFHISFNDFNVSLNGKGKRKDKCLLWLRAVSVNNLLFRVFTMMFCCC